MYKYILFIIIAGCIDNDSDSYPNSSYIASGDGGQGGTISNNFYQNSCIDGEERACHLTIGNNGVNTCFIGIQVCKNNEWSYCSKK